MKCQVLTDRNFCTATGLRTPKTNANSRASPGSIRRSKRQSGRSSGVEHDLAKVGVEGSKPFARSSDTTNL